MVNPKVLNESHVRLTGVLEVGHDGSTWGDGEWLWAGWLALLASVDVVLPSTDHGVVDAGGVTSPLLGELCIFVHPAGGNGVDVGLVGGNGVLEILGNSLSNVASLLVCGLHVGIDLLLDCITWVLNITSSSGLALSVVSCSGVIGPLSSVCLEASEVLGGVAIGWKSVLSELIGGSQNWVHDLVGVGLDSESRVLNGLDERTGSLLELWLL